MMVDAGKPEIFKGKVFEVFERFVNAHAARLDTSQEFPELRFIHGGNRESPGSGS